MTQANRETVSVSESIWSVLPCLSACIPPIIPHQSGISLKYTYNTEEVHPHGSCSHFPLLRTAIVWDQLIDVFIECVGQAVGFRCVSEQTVRPWSCYNLTHFTPPSLLFGRKTGKSKGYDFCEFAGTSHVPLFLIGSWKARPPYGELR